MLFEKESFDVGETRIVSLRASIELLFGCCLLFVEILFGKEINSTFSCSSSLFEPNGLLFNFKVIN